MTSYDGLITKAYVDGYWDIEEDIIPIDDVASDNKTIAECIKSGTFETFKELCDIDGLEIVLIKKEKIGKPQLRNSNKLATKDVEMESDMELKG